MLLLVDRSTSRVIQLSCSATLSSSLNLLDPLLDIALSSARRSASSAAPPLSPLNVFGKLTFEMNFPSPAPGVSSIIVDSEEMGTSLLSNAGTAEDGEAFTTTSIS